MNTIKTPIVDKNGKATTVYKSAETSIPARNIEAVSAPPKNWMVDSGLGLKVLDSNELYDGYPDDDITISEIKNWEDNLTSRGYIHVIDTDENVYIAHPATGRFANGNITPDGIILNLWGDFGSHELSRKEFDNDESYMGAIENRFDQIWKNN